MKIIQTLISKHNEKRREQNEQCDSLIRQIDNGLYEINSLFSDSTSFIEPEKEKECLSRNSFLQARAGVENVQKLKHADHFQELLEKQANLYRRSSSLRQEIHAHNDNVTNRRIQRAYALLGSVEGKQLDRQQVSCILKDVRNHLVIAGAGTGKTTTVVGKIKFLLKSGICKPEDILVLSFTNASASEMNSRIAQETGYNIDAMTFHKLGLSIIAKADNIVPKITQLNMRKFIQE